MAFDIPKRVDGLSQRQLLEQAVRATEEAANGAVGWQDKAALWVFAQLCLSERAGKTMLRYTLAITVLTVIMTVVTAYQVLYK
jgi:hypothetical protein